MCFLAQPQLISCFSALEMTGFNIQGGCNFLETICQSQCDGSGIAQTSPLGIQLEERDGGVHHYLEASGRNLFLKRAPYECTIITISLWQKRLKSSSKPDSLHSLRQDVWSCLSILCRCRPSPFVVALAYKCNR